MNDIEFLDFSEFIELTSQELEKYFIHILCTRGSWEIEIETTTHPIKKDDILILLPRGKYKFLAPSKDFQACCFLVSFELMSRNNPDVGWSIKGYIFSKVNPVVKMMNADINKYLSNCNQIKETYENETNRFKIEILNLQIQLFILEMWNIFSKQIEVRSITTEKGTLFEQFLQLVNEHCSEEREVDFYAGKLFITPKYLTEICKTNSGKTASAWIQNYTRQRIIILLQNPTFSYTKIAEILCFSSQSFFSRYVRKVLGQSPTEYRKRMLKI